MWYQLILQRWFMIKTTSMWVERICVICFSYLILLSFDVKEGRRGTVKLRAFWGTDRFSRAWGSNPGHGLRVCRASTWGNNSQTGGLSDRRSPLEDPFQPINSRKRSPHCTCKEKECEHRCILFKENCDMYCTCVACKTCKQD